MGKLYSKCKEMFYPNQLRVGTPKGVESAVHSLHAYYQNENTKDKVILKINFKNAFNQISLDIVLQKVKSTVPEIFLFNYQSYITNSKLYLGESLIIKSREGIQHGDPLGPFLFSLATIDLINSCKSELKSFYLDDGTMGGDTETVLCDNKRIQTEAAKIGLEVNTSKCKLFKSRTESEECQNAFVSFCEASPGCFCLKVLDETNFTLLGAPVLPESIEKILSTKLAYQKLMVTKLFSY